MPQTLVIQPMAACMNPPVLHTDQRRCYDESGCEIACAGTGQDAEFERDGSFSAERFQAAGAGLVLDALTGLVWCANANLAEFPLDWSSAHDFVNDLNAAQALGQTHWRLPSRRELFSIISHQAINPALPEGNPFANVFNGYYWTGTPCCRLPDQAWFIHLGGGRVYRGMKHASYILWPVISPRPASSADRLGARPSSGRAGFDPHTGLMWSRPPDDCTELMPWPRALDTIRAMNAQAVEGYTDWRLPNIRELESLVDLDAYSPALVSAFDSPGAAEGYWSSTTSAYEPRYAWVLYTRDGAVGVGFKTKSDFGCLAVRYSGSVTPCG